MLLYLHGFASGPGSFKAQRFARYFAALGVPLTIPALDEGDFTHLTLSRQLRLIERLCQGQRPLVLIGSSMGGYLAALYAARHPVDALLLMAPAVDFARRWRERLGDEAMAAWQLDGVVEVEHLALGRKVPLSYALMVDAETQPPWPLVSAPALVLHGTRDEVVPQARVEHWVAQNPSARLVLLDDGHELTSSIDRILEESHRFLAEFTR